MRPLPTLAALALLLGGCAPGDGDVSDTTSEPTAGASSTTALAPRTTTTTTPVVVDYRIERLTSDEATAGFEAVVESTLEDPRGWQRAGFDLVQRADAEHVIVLAEGDEVDRRCLPYKTYGKYSCQIGPVVALNADRWRTATSKWTGDLSTYRQMLVNHEVGHLLGQHHRRCPGRGEPAPIMLQQSTELGDCLPNPWPLESEIERAARHDLPLAPPFERVPPSGP